MSAPRPAGSMLSMTIWYVDLPGNVVTRPVAITSRPSCGFVFSRAKAIFQITASMRAASSFKEK